MPCGDSNFGFFNENLPFYLVDNLFSVIKMFLLRILGIYYIGYSLKMVWN